MQKQHQRCALRVSQTHNQTYCLGCRPRRRHQLHKPFTTYHVYNRLQETTSSGLQQNRGKEQRTKKQGKRRQQEFRPLPSTSPIANLQSTSQDSPKETSASGPARGRIHESRKPAREHHFVPDGVSGKGEPNKVTRASALAARAQSTVGRSVFTPYQRGRARPAIACSVLGATRSNLDLPPARCHQQQ
jgi:hypothetical protein